MWNGDDALSETVSGALACLARHGVAVRALAPVELRRLSVAELEQVVAWFNDPSTYAQPTCIQCAAAPVVRLARRGENG